MWHKLLNYRDLARQFHKVEVVSGKTVSFWYDNWSSLGCLLDITGLRGVIDLGIPINSLISDISPLRRRKKHRTEILNKIEEEIATLQSRMSEGEDTHLWKQKAGSYNSTFSTSKTANQIRTSRTPTSWFRGVWFKNATPKFSFQVWMAYVNRLSTADKINQWRPGSDLACLFCQRQVETRNHLFFECRFTRRIWEHLAGGLMGFQLSCNWETITQFINQKDRPFLLTFLLRYVFQISVYNIWWERNSRHYGGQPSSLRRLITITDKGIRNRITSLNTLMDSCYRNCYQTWISSRSL